MQNLSANRLFPLVVPIPLMVCSVTWLAAVAAWFGTGTQYGNWSAMPVGLLLVLTVIPAICFAFGLILFDARKRGPLARFAKFALSTALVPVSAGTFLAVCAIKALI